MMNKRGLLNFAIDHLVLNIGYGEVTAEEVAKLNIFKVCKDFELIGLNGTNNSEKMDYFWEAVGHYVIVNCDESVHGHMFYAIIFRGRRIMRIERIKVNSRLKKNLKYKYSFRITFYGTFFSLNKLKTIEINDFLIPFWQDVSHCFIKHSISRIDICADIFGVSVNSISKGIKGVKSKMKISTPMNIDPITKEPETFYYGSRKDGGTWLVRIYNKLLQIKKLNKELLHLDLLNYEKVTRLEI